MIEGASDYRRAERWLGETGDSDPRAKWRGNSPSTRDLVKLNSMVIHLRYIWRLLQLYYDCNVAIGFGMI
jgi:hypothetical protein